MNNLQGEEYIVGVTLNGFKKILKWGQHGGILRGGQHGGIIDGRMGSLNGGILRDGPTWGKNLGEDNMGEY